LTIGKYTGRSVPPFSELITQRELDLPGRSSTNSPSAALTASAAEKMREQVEDDDDAVQTGERNDSSRQPSVQQDPKRKDYQANPLPGLHDGTLLFER